MDDQYSSDSFLNNQRGAIAIIVGILAGLVLFGFAALAIDVGHLAVVRNELQNAADAGALAGARVLYSHGGSSLNTGTASTAQQVATSNASDGQPVEVNLAGNGGDVQIGHWSFASRSFTAYSGNLESYEPVDLWDVTTQELDANINFINAVKVIARRSSALSFFARILGHESFNMQAQAVAYIGFAGSLTPESVDQPIVVCSESILNAQGEYTCTIGRMINSGENLTSHETAGWSDFNQDNPCSGGTNANAVRDLVCSEGNENPIVLGEVIATNGGEIQTAFDRLRDCWWNNSELDTNGDGVPDQPWNLTLPVVLCPGNNITTCQTVTGAVNLNIIWITEAGNDPHYNNVPREMGDWACPVSESGEWCWNDFVSESNFNLKNLDGSLAPYQKKAIYFLPDCTPHEPTGHSGGRNFGILAKIPVLVQ